MPNTIILPISAKLLLFHLLIKKNEKADFSNYGKCVDIAAPGVGVYTCELDGTYSYENGTSFSAPFVSAAAQLF